MAPLSPPTHFEAVQAEAVERWRKLERDPELAGPWWQLFRQIQSPRHVLSELIQNADDAEAGSARAEIRNGVFTFVHDGRDFDELSLRSLCRFGSSNKRTLATIGFRGMGFKSAFSLGPRVEVRSPSLSFAFERARFSEPIWIGDHDPESSLTSIRIPLRDQEVLKVLQSEMERWIGDPVSMLFFRNLETLKLQGTRVERRPIGPGPVENSVRVKVSSREDYELTVVSSVERNLPDDAWEEIRDERRLVGGLDERVPARVQLILDSSESRLYVVLPTEVELTTPFSINAPFIQDPARVRIKPPSQSPTNRWLLQEAGLLAARAMVAWAQQRDLGPMRRVQAYRDLLPWGPGTDVQSATGDINSVVVNAFADGVEGEPFIVDADENSRVPTGSVALDDSLFDVWPSEVLQAVWTPSEGSLLTPGVLRDWRRRLERWAFLRHVSAENVLETLAERSLDRPDGHHRLVNLWAYIEKNLPDPPSRWERGPVRERLARLRIVPVAGDSELHATRTLIWPSGGSGLVESDWAFLSSIVPAADRQWLGWLERLEAEENPRSPVEEGAITLAERLRSTARTGAQEVLKRVCQRVFATKDARALDLGMKLAFLVARLSLTPPHNFRFLCDDGTWRGTRHTILGDPDPAAALLPRDRLAQHLLSPRYDSSVAPAERQSWFRWKRSSNSGLRRFVVPEPNEDRCYDQEELDEALKRRGGAAPDETPIQREHFRIRDWDFDEGLWDHWEQLSKSNHELWCELTKAIASDWGPEWEKRTKLAVWQLGYSREHSISPRGAASSWIHKLKNLPCLPDERGLPSIPSELLRMNPRTAHLRGVERALNPEWDIVENDRLLSILGVRESADNADVLLDRVTSLSGSDVPDRALTRLYETIDRSLPELSRDQRGVVRAAFNDRALIRAANGHWYRSRQIFQANPLGIPSIPLVPDKLVRLALWDSVGVPREVDQGTALDFLRAIEPGRVLSGEKVSSVREILARFPVAVWTELSRWLAADGSWRKVNEFAYYSHRPEASSALFPHRQRQIADVSMVPQGQWTSLDWDSALPLAQALEVRPTHQAADRTTGARWMNALGHLMTRVPGLSDESPEAQSQRAEFASELKTGQIRVVEGLTGIPLLGGTPAGPARGFRAIWYEEGLFCTDSGPAIHSDLVRVLQDRVTAPELRAAIGACVDRDPSWIAEYFAHHFDLLPAPEEPPRPAGEGPLVLSGEIGQDDPPTSGDGPTTDPPAHSSETPGDAPEDEAPEGEQYGVGAPGVTPEGEVGADSPVRPKKPAATSAVALEVSHFRTRGFGPTADRNSSRLVHQESGDILVRESGGWLRRSPSGEVVRRYLSVRGSLARGIELSHLAYGQLLDGAVPASLLVVGDKASGVRELSSEELRGLREEGSLKVFPHTYRLRVDPDVEGRS